MQGFDADACGALKDRRCRHFKSKFCEECRWAMAIPGERVRPLNKQAARVLENRHSGGVWSVAPERLGSFRFRIINNTKDCHAPALVVFEKAPPPSCVCWKELDSIFLDDNGMVQLCVRKGTAVPIHHVKGRERVGFEMRKPASPSSSSTMESPSRSDPEPPPRMSR